jgi:hypothetical protein
MAKKVRMMGRPGFLDLNVVRYWRAGYSLRMIGGLYGASAMGVKKHLNRLGVDTGRVCLHFETICAHCGRVCRVPRYRYRVALERPWYCSQGCRVGVSGGRAFGGRRVISVFLRLRRGWVVHHEDGDDGNNELANLIVFRGQGDHLRWHRCGGEKSGVIPVWRRNLRDLQKRGRDAVVEV